MGKNCQNILDKNYENYTESDYAATIKVNDYLFVTCHNYIKYETENEMIMAFKLLEIKTQFMRCLCDAASFDE